MSVIAQVIESTCSVLLECVERVRQIATLGDHDGTLDVAHEDAGEVGGAATDERRVVGGEDDSVAEVSGGRRVRVASEMAYCPCLSGVPGHLAQRDVA
jgi:hypothetical protein